MIRNHTLIMNIKTIKIHEYLAIKIMLDFESKRVHFNFESIVFSNLKQAKKELSSHQY